MRVIPLRGDLALLGEGVALGWRFGLGSLEQLARTAWELEHGVYRRGSLVRTPAGVAFGLLNPPLRIGAFRGLSARWDDAPVSADRLSVSTDRRPLPRSAESVTAGDPLELGVGEASRYEIRLPDDPGATSHRVRLEWQSVAVPPLVWLEFTDTVRPPGDR